MTDRERQIDRAALAISSRLPDDTPELLLTLGSGLGPVADRIEDAVDIPLAAVPGLPVSVVPGHSGRLRYGRLGDRVVLAQLGRIHLYEGHSAAEVTRMVEVAARLGCSTFVVTNAAGGITDAFTPGDLMVIDDHLNLTGDSPLTGVIRNGGPVFLDMAMPYDVRLRRLAHDRASARGLELQRGVYAGLRGPAYETPAEVAMLRTLGAHAVGMSTVLEVVAARSHGMEVLGISSITNVHGEGVETTHDEVLEVGMVAAERLGGLLLDLVEHI